MCSKFLFLNQIPLSDAALVFKVTVCIQVELSNCCSQIGLIGLIEDEWVATLAMVDSTLVHVFDFVLLGRRLARLLKEDFVCSPVACLDISVRSLEPSCNQQ